MKGKKINFRIILLLLFLLNTFQVRADTQSSKAGAVTKPQKIPLTSNEKKYILNLARQTLIQYFKGEPIPKIEMESLSPVLREKRGCFVTIEKNGELRGCIGNIQPQKPLCDCVVENAISAATQDPRFTEVRPDELNSITLEISVLTVPEKLDIKERKKLLQVLVAGRDGVILRQGWYQATFLPQVWKHFSNKESFLNALCQKGGMIQGCWKEEDTEIFTYQAEVFKEKEYR